MNRGAALPLKFARGLSLYLSQANKSLDRVYVDYRSELVRYLRERGLPSPGDLANRLTAHADATPLRELLHRLRALFRLGVVWLPARSVERIATSLRAYDRHLNGEGVEDDTHRVAIRSEVVKAIAVLDERMPFWLHLESNRVEHYNQAHETNLPIEAIAGTGCFDATLGPMRRRG